MARSSSGAVGVSLELPLPMFELPALALGGIGALFCRNGLDLRQTMDDLAWNSRGSCDPDDALRALLACWKMLVETPDEYE